jgi:hypothetical protein
MARPYAGAGARVYAIIIVEGVLGFAVHTEISIGPETSVVNLLSRALVVGLIIVGRAGAPGVSAVCVVLVLIEQLILILVAVGVSDIGGVAGLELALLGAAASSAGPGESTRGLLE